MATVSHDARVAALLRRTLPAQPTAASLTVCSLLGVSAAHDTAKTTTISTFTTQQQLLQEIEDARAVRASARVDTSKRTRPSLTTNTDVDVEQRITELYELCEVLGDGHPSNVEREYLSLIEHDIVGRLTSRVRAAVDTEAHKPIGNVKEACCSLLALCVKPTALARSLAFSLMHGVAVQATWLSMEATPSGPADTHSQMTQLECDLFACVADMLVKSVAVASTEDVPPPGDSAWALQVTVCLLPFLRYPGGGYQYHTDRLVRLDASALTFLTRRAFCLSTATARQTEVQDTLLEILIAAIYAHQSRAQATAVTTGGIAIADIERFGGLDWLLAIFYSTPSDRSRRLVLGVVFDLVVGQVKRSNPSVDSKEASVCSYDRLLRCLHQFEFASLVATSPVTFVTHAARRIKMLHAAVETELLETNVASVWSGLRSMLQIDEYFVQSASLAHVLKLWSTATQKPRESAAESIATKAHQLIVSPRLEDRFKGERWLAELLVRGLEGEPGERSDPKASGNSNDQLEESMCYDEDADIRLTAGATLWELSRSSSTGSRLAYARVLALFTKKRIRKEAPSSLVSVHLRDLSQCFDALVAQNEDAPTILLVLLDMLLQLVVVPYEVSYLAIQRQRYDYDSSDAPIELIGSLVASDTLASKVLCGAVGVDRIHVAEIPLPFLMHALDVLDSTLVDGTPSLAADFATVTALLVSYALEDAPISCDVYSTLEPFLDSLDLRIAAIAARSITTQFKRDIGDQRYTEIVREAHAAAVESDDETPLADSVAHARLLLFKLHENQLTP